MLVDIESILPFSLILLVPILAYLKWRRNVGAGYLLCFSVFYMYIVSVVGYTVLPIRIDREYVEYSRQVALYHGGFMSNMNLIPLRNMSIDYLLSIQGIGNLLLGMPFGFGLPFISAKTPNLRSIAWKGLLFTFSIEILQLVTNIGGYTFPPRVIDVNDSVLNLFGAFIGFWLFTLTSVLYRRAMANEEYGDGVWLYIHTVLTR